MKYKIMVKKREANLPISRSNSSYLHLMIKFDPELSSSQSKKEHMVNYIVLIIRKRKNRMEGYCLTLAAV